MVDKIDQKVRQISASKDDPEVLDFEFEYIKHSYPCLMKQNVNCNFKSANEIVKFIITVMF